MQVFREAIKKLMTGIAGVTLCTSNYITALLNKFSLLHITVKNRSSHTKASN